MDIRKYQFEVGETAKPGLRLEQWVLGLASEVGEVANLLKGTRIVTDLDLELRAELGDVAWYLAQCCTAAGLDLGDVLEFNLRKLRDRHGPSYGGDRK